jgi:antitoxin component HigA of HigAB toxin-antitoxin module
MTIKPVKDDADHKAALARIEALIDRNPQPDSP